jgi:hypothetical protein
MKRVLGSVGVSVAVVAIATTAWAQGLPGAGGPGGKRSRGADTGGDAESEASEPGQPRVPWRGTALKWSQTVTTTALGIGADTQGSDHEVYAHGYWALLNYFLIEDDVGTLRASTSPGFDVELTNSETTTTKREPQLRDMNLSFVGVLPVASDDRQNVSFLVVPNLTSLFPTSKPSRSRGTVFVSSPRLSAVLATPFLRGADFPSSFALFSSVRWDHRFTKADVPVNERLEELPRTSQESAPFFSDQLSSSANAHDALSVSGAAFFSGELVGNVTNFTVAVGWSKEYLYAFDDQTITGAGGTELTVGSGTDVQTTRTNASFALEWGYYFPEIGFSLGYDNTGSDLGPDGQRRSIFYSPAAVFSTQLILSIDAIFEGITGPRRAQSFALPG